MYDVGEQLKIIWKLQGEDIDCKYDYLVVHKVLKEAFSVFSN